MKLHFGAIPEAEDFENEGNWQALKEPTPWVYQLLALPVAFLTLIILIPAWSFFTSPISLGNSPSSGITLITIVGIIIVHEGIHALAHPRYGLSDHSVIGFWPSRIIFYAHYEGELSRNRFLVVFLMPFLVISILPLIYVMMTGVKSPYLAQISLLNALFACGDLLGAGMIFFQLPKEAIVRNKGWKTFWKVN